MSETLLLAEDDQRLAQLVHAFLEQQGFNVLIEGNGAAVERRIRDDRPDLVILDSISVITSSNASSGAGSISQVKEVAEKMVQYAKQKNITVIIIGHITKDGNLA